MLQQHLQDPNVGQDLGGEITKVLAGLGFAACRLSFSQKKADADTDTRLHLPLRIGHCLKQRIMVKSRNLHGQDCREEGHERGRVPKEIAQLIQEGAGVPKHVLYLVAAPSKIVT